MKISVRRSLVFFSVLLLGLPLNGAIPEPPELIRDLGGADAPPDTVSSTVWATIYLAAALYWLRDLMAKQAMAPPISLVLLALLYFSSTLWSPPGSSLIVVLLQELGCILLACIAARSYRTAPERLLATMSVALGINLAINLAFVLALPAQTISEDGRWSGLSGNPNYLGGLSVVLIICLLGLSYFPPIQRRGWRHVGLFLGLMMIVGSGSVTSLAAAATAVCIHTVGITDQRRGRGSTTLTLFVVTAWLIGATMVLIFAEDILNALGRDTSATGRAVIWLSGWQLVLERPILGYGIGADTLNTGALGWATHFHNGLLQIAVNVGVVGAALFLAAVMGAAAWAIVNYDRPGARLVMLILGAYVMLNVAEVAVFLARNPGWVLFLYVLLVIRANPVSFVRRRAVSKLVSAQGL